MNKFIQFLITLIYAILALFGFSFPNSDSTKPPEKVEEETVVAPTYYDVEKAVVPIWDSNVIVNENIAFKSQDDVATLTYTPTEIISVYDYFLSEQYFEGIDYVVEGNSIRLTQNTAINYWQQYYFEQQSGAFALPTAQGYVTYSETLPNQHQLCVTYRHEDSWDGFVPTQSKNLAPTLDKLRKGDQLNIAVVGDSITDGSGASRFNSICYPNVYAGMLVATPRYSEIIQEFLQLRYKDIYATTGNVINLENCAVGGAGVGSAVNHINNLTQKPDLLIIAYGMNNAGSTVEYYKQYTENAVKRALEINPNCQIMLVATMLPNYECLGWTGNIYAFEQALEELAEKYGAAVVPMTSITDHIYHCKGKRPVDLLSNSINHPSDFLQTVYAQVALTVLLGEGYYTPIQL